MRPPDPRAPESAVDLSELRVLFEGDPDELVAFCADAATAMETALAQLEQATGNQAWDAARAKAHELRGLAGNVGASQLASLCASYETSARLKMAADDAVRAIASAGAIVCDALRSARP